MRRFLIVAGFSASLAFGEQVPGNQRDAVAERVRNPIVAPQCYDATWLRDGDGTFWMTSTHREVLKSRDFVHWERVAKDFFHDATRQRIFGTNGWKNVWAPDIVKFGDEYRIYVALNRSDLDAAIAVYRSKSPKGPYGDERILTRGVDTGIKDTIDPDVVRDPATGKLWLFFGSIGKVHRVELAADGLSLAPGAKYIHVAGLARGDPRESHRDKVFEGTYLYPRGGRWYLFASAGEWSVKGRYRLVVGRADSLTGEFRDREGRLMTDGFATTVLRADPGDDYYNPGHPGEILTDADGRTFLPHFIMHDVPDSESERPLWLDELKWDADGWPFVEGGKPRAIVSAPRIH